MYRTGSPRSQKELTHSNLSPLIMCRLDRREEVELVYYSRIKKDERQGEENVRGGNVTLNYDAQRSQAAKL